MAFLVDSAQYIPPKFIRNEDMTQFPVRFRNMIAEKAGIYSRYHVGEECTSDIGAKAVMNLLSKTGLDPLSVDALICATSSPDRLLPATATRIQLLSGLNNAFAFDVNSVCAGGVYALRLASSLINDGLKNVIVVAAEVYSKMLNPKDIASYPYFGDGAAAILVSDHGKYEFIDFCLGSNAEKVDSFQIPAGGTILHGSKVTNTDDFFISMKGRAMYEFACEKVPAVIFELIQRQGIEPNRVITNASTFIVQEIAKCTKMPIENFFINVDKYASMAGASCLIALNESLEQNVDDEAIIVAAYGAGLSWGGCYLKRYS